MSQQMDLFTGDPSLPQADEQRLLEEILPHLLEYHAGTNLHFIPVNLQRLLSRLHNKPLDEKRESINRLSANQQIFTNAVIKWKNSKKAFKELTTVYEDHSKQADEVDKRFKHATEEGEEALRFLQMKHEQENQYTKMRHEQENQDQIMKQHLEHRNLKSEESENSDAIGKEYENILESVTYHKSRKDMANMQFETDDEAMTTAKQAVIDSEIEAKRLQIMGAGLMVQPVLPLTNETYPRIIDLMGGVDMIDKLISRLTQPNTAKVCKSLHNLGLHLNSNFKTDGVSLDTKRKQHKERFESAEQHRYRLYQALSHDGNVQYERGKILEKELQDKEAETEAKETRILDEATVLNRKRDPITQELDYTPSGKRKRDELNRVYRSPSPGFSSTRIKRSRSRFTSPANGLRQSQTFSQDTRNGSPAVFTPRTLDAMFEE